MDPAIAFQVIFAAENHSKIPVEQTVLIYLTLMVLWKLVRIKAECAQGSGRISKWPLLPKGAAYEKIWGGLTLAVILYRCWFFAVDELSSYVPMLPQWIQYAGGLLERYPFLALVFSVWFPLPATVWETVWNQMPYFLMLGTLLILEVYSHEDIRDWIRGNHRIKDREPAEKGNRKNVGPQKGKKWKSKKVEAKQRPKRSDLYEYDEDLTRGFLKEEYKWLRVLYPAVLMILLLGNAAMKSKTGLLFFPIYAITEFWMETAIPTRKEFLEKKQRQNSNVEKQNSFNALMEKLDTAAQSKTWPKLKKRNNDSVGQAWKSRKIEQEQTQEEKLVSYYISLCRDAGVDADPVLAGAAKALLCGKSVVFSTRFYQDMDYSFYLPMLRVLQSGYRCLILTGDQINMKPIEDWLLDGRRYIIGDTAIWQMGEVDASSMYQPDVGYMMAECLGNTKLLQQNDFFFEKVRLVLIVNASALLHKQLFGIMRLRKRLHPRCAFAICNDNAEGLTDIYSHLLQTELNLVYPSTESAKESYYLFCDEEQRPGSDVLECGQLELSRMLLGENTDVIPKVRWYSKISTPLKDIANLYGMLKSADEYDSHEDQGGKLVFGTDDANCPREDFSCVIVEDEIHNPAELGVQFASRGRLAALVAVFSPYYFFRDYIRENWRQFYENHRKITQTLPGYCMSERNAVLQMMWNMQEERLDENDISAICALLGQHQLEKRLKPQGRVDWQKLAKVFCEYTGMENMEYYLHYEHKFDRGKTIYEFWLDDIPDGFYDKKRPCFLTCTAFGLERRPLAQYSKIQLQQCYLPGQLISIAGQCYEVKDFFESRNTLELSVRRSAQCVCLRTSYRQKRQVVVRQVTETGIQKVCLFREGADMLCIKELLSSDMDVTIEGYWSISGGRTDQYISVAGQEIQHHFSRKKLLCLELQRKAKDGGDLDVGGTMQCLMFELSELFRTIYAEYEHQLLVCKQVSEANGMVIMENFGQDEQEKDAPSATCFYIVEDSEEDIGLLDSILMHIDRLLQTILEAEHWNAGRVHQA